MTIAYLDTETQNRLTPLSRGVYNYAQNVKLLTVQFAIDDGPIVVLDWINGDRSPLLDEVLHDPRILLIVHGANFDRVMLGKASNATLLMRHAARDITRWRCTMARALLHGLPGGLDALSKVYKLGELSKLKGRHLMRLFCTPRPKNAKEKDPSSETHPDEWREFLEYARGDIPPLRELWKVLPRWNYSDAEVALWHLDQKINDRGFMLDLDFVRGAMSAVKSAQTSLDHETGTLTDGQLTTTRRVAAVREYIEESYGVHMPNMQLATIERFIASDDTPGPLRRLLQVRAGAGAASVSKFKRAYDAVCHDGRVRGALQYCGARRTRRWAGRLVQVHNFMRPEGGWPIEADTDAFRSGMGEFLLPDPIRSAQNCIRSMIVPTAGMRLIWSDYKSIESRLAAWFAGERWKLDAFASGADVYVATVTKSFGVAAADVDKEMRQLGKVSELSGQFSGNVNALVSMGITYGYEAHKLVDMAEPTVPDALLIEAESFFDWRIEKGLSVYGLDRREYSVLNAVVRGWRQANPNIVRLWKSLTDAAIAAYHHPETWYPAGPLLRFIRLGNWLLLRLPSGQFVCYPGIRYYARQTVQQQGPRAKVYYANSLSYAGYDAGSNIELLPVALSGGIMLQNSCEGVARDLMGHAMPSIERAGYRLLFTVHDEIVTEAPIADIRFSVAGLEHLMCDAPAWAKGLPLAAEGDADMRYRK